MRQVLINQPIIQIFTNVTNWLHCFLIENFPRMFPPVQYQVIWAPQLISTHNKYNPVIKTPGWRSSQDLSWLARPNPYTATGLPRQDSAPAGVSLYLCPWTVTLTHQASHLTLPGSLLCCAPLAGTGHPRPCTLGVGCQVASVVRGAMQQEAG